MYIAIPSTIVMILLTMFSLFGGDVDGMDGELDFDSDLDMDTDGSGGGLMDFPIFTFKNFFTFLTMFGWVGMTSVSYGLNNLLSIVIAVIVGVIFTAMVNVMFILIHRLSYSNVMSYKEAIGKEVTVYSKISKGMPGQVTVTLNKSLQVVKASSDTTLDTGDKARVVSVTGTELVVDKI